jgi:hypothetical protein
MAQYIAGATGGTKRGGAGQSISDTKRAAEMGEILQGLEQFS